MNTFHKDQRKGVARSLLQWRLFLEHLKHVYIFVPALHCEDGMMLHFR
jgi:hypothetical protein